VLFVKGHKKCFWGNKVVIFPGFNKIFSILAVGGNNFVRVFGKYDRTILRDGLCVRPV